jgi:hypothetical protein
MTCCDCGGPVVGRADKLYCSDLCRLRAFRRRSRERVELSLRSPSTEELLARISEPRLEAALVSGVARAAARDWRAAVWILERRWPQRWALNRRSTRLEAALEDEFELPVDVD